MDDNKNKFTAEELIKKDKYLLAEETRQKRIGRFALWNKAVTTIYRDDRSLRAYYDKVDNSRYARIRDIEAIRRDLYNMEQNSENAGKISSTLASLDANYSAMVEYFANMYLYRYTATILYKGEGEPPIEEYANAYNDYMEYVEGISIETVFPEIMRHGIVFGSVYLYTTRNTSSKTISTMILPNEYCRRGPQTNFGTYLYAIDITYFDDVFNGLTEEEVEAATKLYPKDLIKAYEEYNNGGPQWVPVDGRRGGYIEFKEKGLPRLVTAAYGIYEFERYRENELEKNSNLLTKILTHRIPLNNDKELIFEPEEVQVLHSNMARSLTSNSDLKLLTTFGDTEVHDIQSESSVVNEVVKNAYDSIFYLAGLNPAIFNGDSVEALKVSITRDSSYLWRIIQNLVRFYNVALNHHVKHKGYNMTVDILNLTQYNIDDKVNGYIDTAKYGIGKLEAVVASGVKQINIPHKARLEQYLALDTILVPLQSSHTTSGKPGEPAPDETETVQTTDAEPTNEDTEPQDDATEV